GRLGVLAAAARALAALLGWREICHKRGLAFEATRTRSEREERSTRKVIGVERCGQRGLLFRCVERGDGGFGIAFHRTDDPIYGSQKFGRDMAAFTSGNKKCTRALEIIFERARVLLV